MTASELFIIKTALHLLADQIHQNLLKGNGSTDDFNAISELEKSFVIAYQNKVCA
jgi:hypothetical protein